MAKDANGNDIPENSSGNSAPSTAAKPKVFEADPEFFNKTVNNLLSLGQTATTTAGGVKMLGDNAKPAATALGEFAQGALKWTNLGDAAKATFDELEASRVKVNKAGQQGLAGLDQSGYANQMARSRMSTEQYLDMMAKQSVALQGLGKNANETGKTLTDLTTETRNSRLGKQLEAYGITLNDEYIKLQALGSMYTKENLQGPEGSQGAANRKKLSEANAELAKELQIAANATGRNRQEIEAEIEARAKEAKYSAALQGMDEEQRKNFFRTQAQVSVFGKTAEDVAATIAIGGRRTEEQNNYLMSMGPKASREFERAAQLSASKDEESRKVGRAMMQRALADAADYRQNNPDFRKQISYGGPVADAYQKAQEEDRISQRVAQAKRDSNGTLTNQQALEQVRRDARFAPDKTDNKQALQIETNKNQGRGADAAAAITKGIDDAIAKGAGLQAGKAIDSYSKAVFGSGKSAEAATTYIDNFITTLTGVAKPSGKPAVSTTNSDGTPMQNPSKVPSAAEAEASRKDAQKNAQPATIPANPSNLPRAPSTTPASPAVNPSASQSTPASPAVNPSASQPTPANPSNLPSAGPGWWERNMPSWLGGASAKPVNRANTSLIETGSLIEQFKSTGTPALLHDKEGVVNMQQLNNIARGSKNSGIEAGFSEVSNMFNGINTKISAINKPTGGYNPSEFVNSTLKTLMEESKTPAPTITEPISQPAIANTDSVTIKDLNEQLMRLNTGITQLVENSVKSVDLNTMQIRATKSLSGNKFA